MKLMFPRYVSSFDCDCTSDQAAERLQNTAEWGGNGLKIVKADDTDDQKLVLRAHTGSYLHRNSFLPLVTVEMKEDLGKTRISVLFELKKSVKVLLTVYCAIALLFEAVVIMLSLMNRAVSVGLLLPLVLVIFSRVLSTLGLYFSSKRVLRILFDALPHGEKAEMPPVQKLRE